MVAVIIGVVLGSIAALNRNRFLDRLIIFLPPCLHPCRALCSRPCCCSRFVLSCSGFRPESGKSGITSCRLSRCRHLRWRTLPLDKDQHAGRAGAGLCADGEGGRSEVEDHLQLPPAKRDDSGHHLWGPMTAYIFDRVSGCRKNFYHRRTGREVC